MIVQGQEIGEWVCQSATGNWTHLCQAIGEIRSNKIVAGVMYDNYTGASISIHSRIDYPKSVTKEFYWSVFNYPFNKLKVKRLTGLVSIHNLKAQRLNEHLGFEREAILKDFLPDGDAIIYAMWADKCKFLKLGAKYDK